MQACLELSDMHACTCRLHSRMCRLHMHVARPTRVVPKTRHISASTEVAAASSHASHAQAMQADPACSLHACQCLRKRALVTPAHPPAGAPAGAQLPAAVHGERGRACRPASHHARRRCIRDVCSRAPGGGAQPLGAALALGAWAQAALQRARGMTSRRVQCQQAGRHYT